jgi:hypothetical protein
MSAVSTMLVQSFCERLPDGITLVRARVNQGKVDVEASGVVHHLHLPFDVLDTLLDGAVKDGMDIWGQSLAPTEVAVRLLGIYLAECNLAEHAESHWTYGLGGFQPGAPWEAGRA